MMSSTGPRRSLKEAAKSLYALGGVRRFYRGLTIGLVGVFPYSAIDMSTFEALKLAYLRSTGKEEPGVLALLVCGSISGSVGATSVYPLNLVRTRLQASGSSGHPQKYTGIMDVVHQTYARDGWRGFYRGLLPTLAKVVPAVSISYVVYESTKRKCVFSFFFLSPALLPVLMLDAAEIADWPFTLWEAVQLDVQIITEEIARLQNSLAHLKSTQESLQEAIDETHDPDFVQAMEENAGVIGSQEERISILRMALSQKGIPAEAFCANGSQSQPTPAQPPSPGHAEQEQLPRVISNGRVTENAQHAQPVESRADEDGGIDLHLAGSHKCCIATSLHTTTSTMFILDPHSILLAVPRNIVTAVGLPLAGGFYSGSYTGTVVRGKWYNVRVFSVLPTLHWSADCAQNLIFPPGRPANPGRVFPIVWGTLYTAVGLASYYAYEAYENSYMTEDLNAASKAITLYYVQLGLNFLWTPLFFVKKQTTLALADCALLTGTSIYMTKLLHGISGGKTTWFLAPYCGWLLYATYLNAGVVYLNRGRNLPKED
ncbi:hypothetical protein NM688_g8761 [Phlebia brevispora]|uniref:Uncharacterized protein n=1 Tax=Phlebia brevispora TaxID=194682 RepID=A0ACC1RQV0_9APHY|nr:hypothetical protein NM688_g8761 [Phlebia brevispora]